MLHAVLDERFRRLDAEIAARWAEIGDLEARSEADAGEGGGR